jgi:hypothetical protein
MNASEVREIIREEVPKLLQEDEETQQKVFQLARPQFADKQVTESRFDRILEELQRDREEDRRKWDEQNRKWWENQRVLDEILGEIRRLDRRIDTRIGALGARWGGQSEQAFRDALRAILEESFGVQVLNVVEFDDTGEVHGQPDQVEFDLIIKNGELIICELKSSISKSEIYTFYRAVKFYEKRHGRQANRLIVVSPMIDRRAYRVAKQLGIETYTYAEEVDLD